jgi:hypothetical protein
MTQMLRWYRGRALSSDRRFRVQVHTAPSYPSADLHHILSIAQQYWRRRIWVHLVHATRRCFSQLEGIRVVTTVVLGDDTTVARDKGVARDGDLQAGADSAAWMRKCDGAARARATRDCDGGHAKPDASDEQARGDTLEEWSQPTTDDENIKVTHDDRRNEVDKYGRCRGLPDHGADDDEGEGSAL